MPDTTVGTGGFSFLGIYGDAGEKFGRFRLTLGDGGALGVGGTCTVDCVALDDFIYAEPQAAVPEPGTLLPVPGGLLSLMGLRRFRRISRR